jgi:hypothetical protein
MAIIRTQLVGSERRIITKVVNGQRRVSCSCCPSEGCCMYPASQLGVGYGQDDLPNEIENFIDVFGNRGIWTKSGMKYLADFTDDDQTYAAEITVDTDSLGNKGWVFRGEGEAIVNILGECLFFSSELAATDLFADTYTVTVGSTTGTVTRESLCVWRGLTSDGCPIALSYDRGIEEIEIDAAALKWAIRIIFFIPDFGCEGGGAIFIKAAQDSPVGSDYIDDNIFSSLTATVSE